MRHPKYSALVFQNTRSTLNTLVRNIQNPIYHSTGSRSPGSLSADAFSLVRTYQAKAHQGERATTSPWFENYSRKLVILNAITYFIKTWALSTVGIGQKFESYSVWVYSFRKTNRLPKAYSVPTRLRSVETIVRIDDGIFPHPVIFNSIDFFLPTPNFLFCPLPYPFRSSISSRSLNY